MQKFFLIVLLTIFSITGINIERATAQQAEPNNTFFGITGSIGSSSHLKNFRFVSGDINLDFTPNFTTSFNVGFVFRRKISDRFRFQTEPSIARFGAGYSEGFELRGFNFQTDSQTELLYVQLPLLIQLTTVPTQQTVYGRRRSETTYHFTGGVFGGYLLDAQFSGTNTGAPIGIEFAGSFSNDIIDQYSDFDGGIVLGTGFEHGYNTKIGLEGRVHFSVIDSGDVENYGFKPQNLAFSLTGYFLF